MVEVTIFNAVVIALVVIIHYEFLHRMTMWMPKMIVRHRVRIMVGVFAALIAHVMEMWIFGIAFYLSEHVLHWGYLQGNTSGTLLDAVYYSFTTYSTVGFGDIEPIGKIRYLSGLEATTGLVLITWTASFFYIEMTRYWDSE